MLADRHRLNPEELVGVFKYMIATQYVFDYNELHLVVEWRRNEKAVDFTFHFTIKVIQKEHYADYIRDTDTITILDSNTWEEVDNIFHSVIVNLEKIDL